MQVASVKFNGSSHSEKNWQRILPCSGAVPVEDVEVFARKEFAAVHARLDGAQTSEYPNLLYVTHQRHDVQPLQLCVDGVEPADQVFEEEFEGLGEAEHGVSGDDEGSNLLPPVVDQLTLVSCRVGGGYRGRAGVRPRRRVVVCHRHQVQRRVRHHAEDAQPRRRQRQMRTHHPAGLANRRRRTVVYSWRLLFDAGGRTFGRRRPVTARLYVVLFHLIGYCITHSHSRTSHGRDPICNNSSAGRPLVEGRAGGGAVPGCLSLASPLPPRPRHWPLLPTPPLLFTPQLLPQTNNTE